MDFTIVNQAFWRPQLTETTQTGCFDVRFHRMSAHGHLMGAISFVELMGHGWLALKTPWNHAYCALALRRSDVWRNKQLVFPCISMYFFSWPASNVASTWLKHPLPWPLPVLTSRFHGDLIGVDHHIPQDRGRKGYGKGSKGGENNCDVAMWRWRWHAMACLIQSKAGGFRSIPTMLINW